MYMLKRYLFVDESGDIGSITRRGSSRIFVLSAVLFKDQLSTLTAVEKIRNLKQQLKLDAYYEFKFHRSKEFNKESFFEVVKSVDCRLFSLIDYKRTTAPASTYEDYLSYLLNLIRNDLRTRSSNLLIIIDGEGSSRHLVKIKKTLKAKVPGMHLEVRYSNSRNDELIQIADMISGLVYEQEDISRLSGVRAIVYKKYAVSISV